MASRIAPSPVRPRPVGGAQLGPGAFAAGPTCGVIVDLLITPVGVRAPARFRTAAEGAEDRPSSPGALVAGANPGQALLVRRDGTEAGDVVGHPGLGSVGGCGANLIGGLARRCGGAVGGVV
ncbi:hypothetical protein [Streptomyces sp. NPDC005209]|uniref:hypothetical protein n=1 Tax=Streptomyces sp. NPDC005209 TaxID=3156715 RepID=UPI0033BC900A